VPREVLPALFGPAPGKAPNPRTTRSRQLAPILILVKDKHFANAHVNPFEIDLTVWDNILPEREKVVNGKKTIAMYF
jgi:hypothetical protein